MIQKYVNLSDKPIESLFYFPKDIDSVITQITCEFTLRDGSKKQLATKVEEKKKAEVKYEDAVASGQTVVMGSFSKLNKEMVRICIGQFPPMARAELKITFCQKLEYEDLSYCLRIP